MEKPLLLRGQKTVPVSNAMPVKNAMPPLSDEDYQRLSGRIAQLGGIRITSVEIYHIHSQGKNGTFIQTFMKSCQPTRILSEYYFCNDRELSPEAQMDFDDDWHAVRRDPLALATFQKHIKRIRSLIAEYQKRLDEHDAGIAARASKSEVPTAEVPTAEVPSFDATAARHTLQSASQGRLLDRRGLPALTPLVGRCSDDCDDIHRARYAPADLSRLPKVVLPRTREGPHIAQTSKPLVEHQSVPGRKCLPVSIPSPYHCLVDSGDIHRAEQTHAELRHHGKAALPRGRYGPHIAQPSKSLAEYQKDKDALGESSIEPAHQSKEHTRFAKLELPPRDPERIRRLELNQRDLNKLLRNARESPDFGHLKSLKMSKAKQDDSLVETTIKVKVPSSVPSQWENLAFPSQCQMPKSDKTTSSVSFAASAGEVTLTSLPKAPQLSAQKQSDSIVVPFIKPACEGNLFDRDENSKKHSSAAKEGKTTSSAFLSEAAKRMNIVSLPQGSESPKNHPDTKLVEPSTVPKHEASASSLWEIGYQCRMPKRDKTTPAAFLPASAGDATIESLPRLWQSQDKQQDDLADESLPKRTSQLKIPNALDEVVEQLRARKILRAPTSTPTAPPACDGEIVSRHLDMIPRALDKHHEQTLVEPLIGPATQSKLPDNFLALSKQCEAPDSATITASASQMFHGEMANNNPNAEVEFLSNFLREPCKQPSRPDSKLALHGSLTSDGEAASAPASVKSLPTGQLVDIDIENEKVSKPKADIQMASTAKSSLDDVKVDGWNVVEAADEWYDAVEEPVLTHDGNGEGDDWDLCG
ncbi:MAG: hypothetical protein Q9168_007823 [Polycauliona sp. 1 TL-2023]